MWRSLVSRLNGVQEAAGSNPVTRTMQSVLIGSEYPVMDTLLFYFPQSSYRNLFRGVAECYAFSRFHDNVGPRDLPARAAHQKRRCIGAALGKGLIFYTLFSGKFTDIKVPAVGGAL